MLAEVQSLPGVKEMLTAAQKILGSLVQGKNISVFPGGVFSGSMLIFWGEILTIHTWNTKAHQLFDGCLVRQPYVMI